MAPLIPRIESIEVGLKPLAYLIRPRLDFRGDQIHCDTGYQASPTCDITPRELGGVCARGKTLTWRESESMRLAQDIVSPSTILGRSLIVHVVDITLPSSCLTCEAKRCPNVCRTWKSHLQENACNGFKEGMALQTLTKGMLTARVMTIGG